MLLDSFEEGRRERHGRCNGDGPEGGREVSRRDESSTGSALGG